MAGYFLFSGLVALIDMCAGASEPKSSSHSSWTGNQELRDLHQSPALIFSRRFRVFVRKVGGKSVFVDVTMVPFSSDMELGLRRALAY